MKRPALLLAAVLTLAVAAPAQIVNRALDPAVKPATRTLDCTESGCHAKEKQFKLLHGPNAVNACEACHEYSDPATHTFEYKRQGAELCEFCHIDKSGREGPVVHKPVETGDCLGCHDPHGGDSRAFLKSSGTVELCTSCHKEVMHGLHKHGPAASDCIICHKSHTSSHPKLLSTDSQSLCVTCHEDVGKQATGSKHPHGPAAENCLKCHNSHASDNPKVLVQPVEALCASCHQETVESARHAKHTHGALTGERACLNCHVAHGSEYEKQLSSDPIKACLQCHDKPIEVAPGKIVKGVPEIGMANLHKHGAIEKGDCSGCHDVHGAEHDRLLIANYNNTFYQQYTDQAYELCFKCHSQELVMGNTDDPQTRFRDGGRNLHAMHVNTGRQGRNCRSCHSIHASRFSQLINDEVPFGAWKLPINFTPSENGGSCSPGCHEPQTYDRTKPAGPGAPTTGSTPSPNAPAGAARPSLNLRPNPTPPRAFVPTAAGTTPPTTVGGAATSK